jgi:lysyl-tRNA synthetase class 2
MAAVLLAGSLLAGLLVLQVNLQDSTAAWSWRDRFYTVLHGLVGLSGPVRLPTDRSADLVASILLGLGLMTVVLPILAGLRPSPEERTLSATEAEHVRRLLASRPDGDSLGYFALRDDKAVVFSPSGKAAVSYRVVSGVALASGDPLGDPEAWPGAITAFLEMAASSGWVPAVLGCSERGGTAWNRAGLAAWEIGDEAVVDVAGFTLSGRTMRGVRQAAGRAERAGYATRVRRVADLSPSELDHIRHAAERWRDGPTERGFSMALGRLGGAGDEGCVLVEALHGEQVVALLHFVPWGDDGLSLDLMRRSRDSANGVNELLVVAALAGAADLGVRRVSLNFALFRAALEQGARLGAGPVLRAWRSLLLLASRFWQIDSLYRFNAKFRPQWVPRYVCFRRSNELGRVAVAALQAEAFLPVPKVWPDWLRRSDCQRAC